MKRMRSKITLAIILAVCSLAGCGKAGSAHKNEENKGTASSALTTVATSADKTEAVQTTQTEVDLPDQTEAPQQDNAEAASTELSDSKTEALTEQQALDAIRNYCFAQNPDLKSMADSGEYGIYWDVSANDADEIVVLYRSYTNAQIRYYIDSVSGDTYVTELVPGIIDEEQRTEESFNVRDYLS